MAQRSHRRPTSRPTGRNVYTYQGRDYVRDANGTFRQILKSGKLSTVRRRLPTFRALTQRVERASERRRYVTRGGKSQVVELRRTSRLIRSREGYRLITAYIDGFPTPNSILSNLSNLHPERYSNPYVQIVFRSDLTTEHTDFNISGSAKFRSDPKDISRETSHVTDGSFSVPVEQFISIVMAATSTETIDLNMGFGGTKRTLQDDFESLSTEIWKETLLNMRVPE